jgi:hypothetical protein
MKSTVMADHVSVAFRSTFRQAKESRKETSALIKGAVSLFARIE